MNTPRIPEGLGKLFGISDETAGLLLSHNGWSEDITINDLASWGGSGNIPEPVRQALGTHIVDVSLFIHMGSTIEDIQKSIDDGNDKPVQQPVTEDIDDDTRLILERVVEELQHDIDSGRSTKPSIYVIGDLLFKTVGEEEKIEVLNFFPRYPDDDDLGRSYIEGSAEYFTILDGFQPEEKVMLPRERSFLSTLASEVDPHATRFLVTWMIHIDMNGHTVINQFGIQIGENFTFYDAAFVAMLAEKKNISGPMFTVSIRSIDGDKEYTGSWSCSDGSVLYGMSGEQAESLKEIPGLGIDNATGVGTQDHSVDTLPVNVRLMRNDSEF